MCQSDSPVMQWLMQHIICTGNWSFGWETIGVFMTWLVYRNERLERLEALGRAGTPPAIPLAGGQHAEPHGAGLNALVAFVIYALIALLLAWAGSALTSFGSVLLTRAGLVVLLLLLLVAVWLVRLLFRTFGARNAAYWGVVFGLLAGVFIVRG